MIACACAIAISLASYHFDRTKEWNEVNPGVIVEKSNVVLGAYYNSYSRVSVLAGYNFNLFKHKDVRINLVAGVVTGYAYPAAAVLQFKIGQLGINVVPPIGNATDGVISFTWQIQ